MQSMLWLPHKTVSRGSGSRSLPEPSNYQEAESNAWKSKIVPANSTSTRSLRFSLHSATASQASEVIAAKKIRVYPKNKAIVEQAFCLSRRAYNLAIEAHRDRLDIKPSDLRYMIRGIVRQEAERLNWAFPSATIDEACGKAYDTRCAVIKRRKNGEKCAFQFRSRKSPRQSLIIQKMSRKLNMLGGFRFSERFADEALKKTAILSKENDRYYISVRQTIRTSIPEIQGDVCSIDPGVRTFATVYGGNSVEKWGEGFRERLLSLALQVDGLCSRRKKLLNKCPKTPWRDDMELHLGRKIRRLRAKRVDLLNDLHKRLAYHLVTTFKLILLPTFQTKSMAAKEGRKLRKKTIRQMLDLGHYKFQQMVIWMAKKYGAHVCLVDEAYTSKTLSWTGEIKEIGGSEFVTDGKIKVDRDHNGSRGIALKLLTGTCPLSTTGARFAVFAE